MGWVLRGYNGRFADSMPGRIMLMYLLCYQCFDYFHYLCTIVIVCHTCLIPLRHCRKGSNEGRKAHQFWIRYRINK